MIAGDRARVSVEIAVPPARAFELFTREIDLWWRRGPRFRHLGGERALVAIEPRAGGRVFETLGGGDAAAPVQEIGRVLAWQPPHRLLFEWRNATFAPADRTEVEVRFEATAGGGTRLTLTHRGWATLRPDHPARHGMAAAEFGRSLGLWWGAQMQSLRQIAHPPSAAPPLPPAA